MSAPLVVNTRDGVCWTRRTVTSSGIALYAPEGVCKCPEFVMATLPELAEHGIVGSADVLPVPVGSQQQPVDDDRAKAPWGRDEDGRPFLGPLAHWTDVPELVDQELARIRGRVDQAQSGHWYVASDIETWRPAGTVRTNVDGYQRTVGRVTNMGSADLDLVLHAHDDLSWCLEMVAKFRARVAELEHTVQQMVDGLNGHDCPPPDESPMQAVTRFAVRLMEAERRVAELEAERHETNESVSEAAEALRVQRDRIAELEESPLAWTDQLDSKSLDNFLIALSTATEYEPLSGAVDEIHQLIRSFREHVEPSPQVDAEPVCPCPPAPHQVGCFFDGVPVSPPSERPVDGLTATFAPVASYREDPHDSPLHHDWRIGRDLPELGGGSR